MLLVHGSGEGMHEADERPAASLRQALLSGYEVRSPKTLLEDAGRRQPGVRSVDGHRRVSAACYHGVDPLDAAVTAFGIPLRAPPHGIETGEETGMTPSIQGGAA
jgi:hypothetical protein